MKRKFEKCPCKSDYQDICLTGYYGRSEGLMNETGLSASLIADSAIAMSLLAKVSLSGSNDLPQGIIFVGMQL
jgi:hypothetical protein